MHLCADSIIENLCIPNNAKIIGYTYDHIGWWNDKNFDKKIDIKNIWHSALKDYLISVNIRSINQNDLSRYCEFSNSLPSNLNKNYWEIFYQRWETRALSLNLLPGNADQVILTRPDILWHEPMTSSNEHLTCIGNNSFIDDNFFSGNIYNIKILSYIHIQFKKLLHDHNDFDEHNILNKIFDNYNNLKLLNPNIARYSILNSPNGAYRVC